MGQRENPNAIHRANFPGAAFVRCLSACTWQRHSPRAISSGHSQHSPRRPQPGPASPGVTAWCLGLIRAPGQCCRAHKDTCGTGATRTSPGKRFLMLARTKHVPDLSHCPPKLLVSPPCPQTPQETTAITAISINPHLCTYVKKLILHSWVHFQGFSVHGQESGRTSEGYFLTKPPQCLWLVRSEQLGNEVTLTLWEVNRAQTPKTNQGIFSRVGMMQPCCCGDFPGFPGKLNCAFSW